MKQIFKKVSSLFTVLLMMAVLTLTGVSSVWAADEVDDTVKQTDRKSTRLNSSHNRESRMPSSA